MRELYPAGHGKGSVNPRSGSAPDRYIQSVGLLAISGLMFIAFLFTSSWVQNIQKLLSITRDLTGVHYN
ncbi:MAG: hypothetical protein CMQ21_10835 [Gammaproteobacteria bacterium]|nr:hypothetical protein [Gammaproteobacteria bacterium]